MPAPSGAVAAGEWLHLGFVDCEAGRNWGHACLYVRCGAEEVQVDEGTLPPRLGPDRRLTVLAAGKLVPPWACA